MSASNSSTSAAGSGILLSVHPENITVVAGPRGNSSSKEQRLNEGLLQLNNIAFQPVLFRLKTTAPKRYVVKPTKGIIQPNAGEVIQISLVEDITASCKDEFRLEYTAMQDSDVIASTDAITDIIASRPKGQKIKRDIACVVRLQQQQAVSVVSDTKSESLDNKKQLRSTTSEAKMSKSGNQEALPIIADKPLASNLEIAAQPTAGEVQRGAPSDNPSSSTVSAIQDQNQLKKKGASPAMQPPLPASSGGATGATEVVSKQSGSLSTNSTAPSTSYFYLTIAFLVLVISFLLAR